MNNEMNTYMPTIKFINILLGFCVVSESNGKVLQPAFCIDPLSSNCRLKSKMVQEQKVKQQKQYSREMYFVKELLFSYIPLKRYFSCLLNKKKCKAHNLRNNFHHNVVVA